MKITGISTRKVIKYLSIFLFSVIYLLVFSLWTTPLYKDWYGCDASFFTMAGRGITKGWVPYRDFFDLKGPCFFFLEALGQFIVNGRTGAFVLQVLALFASICIILKLCSLFFFQNNQNETIELELVPVISSPKSKTGFILSVFLVFHIATLWGGNTLEEYMLPLNLLCIYLTLKDLRINKTLTADEIDSELSDIYVAHVRPSTAIITGICFGIILFAKVTVAAPIIGLVIALIIYFIQNKRFRDLIEYLIFALLGLLIPTTLIFIYFAYHHALTDMLYSVFVFAFKRGTDLGQHYNLRWELKISGCYFALIYVICQVIKKPRKKDFLLSSVACIASVTAIALHFGDPFIYYFTTVYSTLVLTFIAIFISYDPVSILGNWRLDIPLLAFAITMCYFASHTASTLNTVIYDRDNTYYEDYASSAREMASLIPDSDRDNVYSFNMDMQWFEITGILPCYSYTINLQYFVALDPRIQDEIINRLDTAPPKWIVVGGDLAGYLPVINDVVSQKYSNIYDNSYGALYLLNN